MAQDDLKSRILDQILAEVQALRVSGLDFKPEYWKDVGPGYGKGGGNQYNKGLGGDKYSKSDPTYGKDSGSFKDAIVLPPSEAVQREIERVTLAELKEFGKRSEPGK